jgi:hypothetical protein
VLGTVINHMTGAAGTFWCQAEEKIGGGTYELSSTVLLLFRCLTTNLDLKLLQLTNVSMYRSLAKMYECWTM